MALYSFSDLEALWIQAGGPAAAAPVAAAVALAESGGDPSATNPTDNNGTQTSWGLWQISDGTHAQPVANVLDPIANAKAAVAKYTAAGNSFARDWGTYSSGAYLKYLPANGTVSSLVNQFVVHDQMTNTVAGTTYTGTGTPPVNSSTSSSTTTAGSAAKGYDPFGIGAAFDSAIAAAQNIALEAFVGAGALALLSGGIIWLASTDSGARSAVKSAALKAAES